MSQGNQAAIAQPPDFIGAILEKFFIRCQKDDSGPGAAQPFQLRNRLSFRDSCKGRKPVVENKLAGQFRETGSTLQNLAGGLSGKSRLTLFNHANDAARRGHEGKPGK